MSRLKTRKQRPYRHGELLPAQLDEPQQTVEALRKGEVDAVVISQPDGEPDVYSLHPCTRLSELEDIAQAIREGSVDALVMRGEDGDTIFTLHTVQEALRQREERLRVAVKNSNITVSTIDCELRCTWIENLPPAFSGKDVIGKRDDEILPPEMAAPMMQMKQEALNSGSGRRGEFEVVVDGRRLVYDVTMEPLREADGSVVGLTCASMDITDRKLLEEERARNAQRIAQALEQRTAELTEAHQVQRRTENMAVLGTLSAGIAHDMGNLLLPLRANLSLLRSQSPESLTEHIDRIEQNVKYIADLATRLRQSMSNAGTGVAVVEALRLDRWGRESAQFFRTIIPSSISFQCEVPTNLPLVLIDKIGLTQAVFNVIQNSIKAMRKTGVGSKIVVRACSEMQDQVALSIEDDGPGMSPEVLARCLELEFTTNREDGGTGLGLPLVKTFMESAGGQLDIASPPPDQQRGTAIVMRFPVHRKM